MNQTIETIKINGIDYVRADAVSAPLPNGNRVVLVVDRGWIFAGDLTEEDGRIYLDRAVHVLSWQTGGFATLCSDPKAAGAKLTKLSSRVDVPEGAEVFRVPVSDSWGL
jgi:hypothetical protein